MFGEGMDVLFSSTKFLCRHRQKSRIEWGQILRVVHYGDAEFRSHLNLLLALRQSLNRRNRKAKEPYIPALHEHRYNLSGPQINSLSVSNRRLIDNSLSCGRQRSSISKKRNTPLPLVCMLPANEPSSTQQRKRKERNESSGSNQSLERKVIR